MKSERKKPSTTSLNSIIKTNEQMNIARNLLAPQFDTISRINEWINAPGKELARIYDRMNIVGDLLAPQFDTISRINERINALGKELARIYDRMNIVGDLLAPQFDTISRINEQINAPGKELARIYDQMNFTSALHHHFDFRIPKTGMNELSVFEKLKMPGFQMAAILGLERLAPQGITADILKYYDEKNNNAPAFIRALEAVHTIDEDSFTAGDVTDFIYHCWEWFYNLISKEKNALARHGYLIIFLYIITIHLANQNYLVAQKGATSQDITTQTSTINEVRNEISALRADNQDKDSHIRYIRDKAYLRAEPNAKSIVLRVVYPDQLLRAINQQGEWVEVEAFDYHSEQPVTGWISRRHLRRTP